MSRPDFFDPDVFQNSQNQKKKAKSIYTFKLRSQERGYGESDSKSNG